MEAWTLLTSAMALTGWVMGCGGDLAPPVRTGVGDQENAMSLSLESLPIRSGPRPRTTPTNPHTQLEQNAPRELQEEVAAFMFGLSCVQETPSRISVPGARAMWLHESCATGPSEAFMIGREFCHLHPPRDGSLHLNLPLEVGRVAIDKGWAENHPLAVRGLIPKTVVMVYGPRDSMELDVVKWLVAASHAFAHPSSASDDR
ncbi:MAG: luciferase family protein [Myxococcota bacterium]